MTHLYRSWVLILAALHIGAWWRGRAYTADEHLHVGLFAVGMWIGAVAYEWWRESRAKKAR